MLNFMLSTLPNIVEHAFILMGQGMLAIFIAIGVIYLSVVLMNYITGVVKKRKQ